jgi:carbon storage regulator CsrA
MLILTRKPGESITITSPGCLPITIQVVDTYGNRSRIGITADASVKILRSELPERPLEYVKRGGAQ